MTGKRQQRNIEQAAGAVAEVLRQTVVATITDGTPEHARQAVREILAYDRRFQATGGGGPASSILVYTLMGWLGHVRVALADRPEAVDEVLAWIEESLGRRYRARARYTSVILRMDTPSDEVANYMEALRDDFLPSLIWLLAGAVARYGDGDVEWLRRLERAPA